MRKPTECSLRAWCLFGVCLFGCGADDRPVGREGRVRLGSAFPSDDC